MARFSPSVSILIAFVVVCTFGAAECLAEENARFWILRGKAFNKSYRYKEAVRAFQKAVECASYYYVDQKGSKERAYERVCDLHHKFFNHHMRVGQSISTKMEVMIVKVAASLC